MEEAREYAKDEAYRGLAIRVMDERKRGYPRLSPSPSQTECGGPSLARVSDRSTTTPKESRRIISQLKEMGARQGPHFLGRRPSAAGEPFVPLRLFVLAQYQALASCASHPLPHDLNDRLKRGAA